VLDIEASGTFGYTHTDSGTDQNATCGNSTGTTPFSDHAELAVDFTAKWKDVEVPFGPIHGIRKVELYNTPVSYGGPYTYSGSGTGDNCDAITWPSGGGSCSGHFESDPNSVSDLFDNETVGNGLTSGKVGLDLVPIEAAMPLTSSPGCTDSDGQLHTFDSAFGGGVEAPSIFVNVDVDPGQGQAAYSFVQGRAQDDVELPPGFLTNCSNPAAELTCSENWYPPASEPSAGVDVEITRVGIVK
jgi:hypothetical protein